MLPGYPAGEAAMLPRYPTSRAVTSMAQSTSDRNLLFGILAIQTCCVTRNAGADHCHEYLGLGKTQPDPLRDGSPSGLALFY